MIDKATVDIIVTVLATLVLLSQIFLGVFLLIFIAQRLNKKNKTLKNIINFFSENSLYFAFLVATVATIGSLFLSEIAGYAPCKLCWLQRIFMYPQVLLLGIASFKNDFGIRKYVIPLVLVGLTIASYHYLLQMSPLPLPCTDEVANCALKQVAPYGYITIPMMAGTAFLLILVFMLLGKKK